MNLDMAVTFVLNFKVIHKGTMNHWDRFDKNTPYHESTQGSNPFLAMLASIEQTINSHNCVNHIKKLLDRVVRNFDPYFLSLLGSVRLGLTVMCQKSDGQPEVCVTPDLPQEWLATLMFMILGVVALTLTCFLLLVSPWKPSIVDAAKWIVFIGSKL